MRSLVRLLIAVILLGTAIQQGWLTSEPRPLAGLAAAAPTPDRDALFRNASSTLKALAGGALATLRGLPDPWYGLALALCGLILVTLLLSALGGAVRLVMRFGGWLRDVTV